ncbi:hypothetical protein BGZ68_002454 [Mortierella alpina]|nr:hypothetical protein BGZ68_002454 [Mortierella alpina]
MPSPPEDINAICDQVIRDEAVVKSDAALADDAQKLPDVAVSTIAESIPKLAINEGTFWSHERALGIPARRIAYGALHRVSGGWGRTVRDAVTCKAHVDYVCPIIETSYVYHDDEVYDSVLTEKSTSITYVTQLIFDSETRAYYAYCRWGETDYKLDGPYGTIESAKEAFQISYKEKFDIEWTERETTVSDKWTYEIQTYEPFEEIEEAEEIVEGSEVERIIARENELRARKKRSGAVVKYAGHGGLEKVDGVWKRTIQVLTTRKAYVDHVCPIAKTSYVYYDDEVYDSVLVEKSTGITYVTQLIFNCETKVYYVYFRWGETDYKMDGPYETSESAKEAFQISYKEKFDVEWVERETTANEKWTYEVKTYETFEEIEEVEEIVEETEAEIINAHKNEIGDGLRAKRKGIRAAAKRAASEKSRPPETIKRSGEIVLEHVTKEVVVDETEKEVAVAEKDIAAKEAKEIVVAKNKEAEKTEVAVQSKEEGFMQQTKVTTAEKPNETIVEETAKEVVITNETSKVTTPSVPEKSSWFRRALSGAEAAALGAGAHVVGAAAVAVGVTLGAGHLASGSLHKVDGVADTYDEEMFYVEDDDDPFILEKARPLAGGKKGGSAGLSTTAIAAVAAASLI